MPKIRLFAVSPSLLPEESERGAKSMEIRPPPPEGDSPFRGHAPLQPDILQNVNSTLEILAYLRAKGRADEKTRVFRALDFST